MHSKKLVHRDLKPSNILLKSDPGDSLLTSEIRLADFGLSQKMIDYELLILRCGTPGYIAPEILNQKPYDLKCDIFSIGCIIYYLLVGDHLFYNKNDIKLTLLRNSRCQIENLDSQLHTFSDECKDFVRHLITRESIERPSAD